MNFMFGHSTLMFVATFILMLSVPLPAPEPPKLWDSAYILFAFDGSQYRAVCTTFPIDKDEERVYFATASHCLTARAFTIAPGLRGYSLLPAEVVADNRPMDVAVLAVRIDPSVVDILPLGQDPQPGDAVQTVIFPKGLFRRLLSGTVASMVNPHSWNLTFDVHLSAPVGGSSGGPILCVEQKAICGLISGYQNTLNSLSVAAPVSHLKELEWRKK